MATKKKNGDPPKWYEIFPQGTTQGDDEQKVFVILARDPNYSWRSVAALAKATGLKQKRVEEIILKYHKKGVILQSPKNEDMWGYWERHKDLVPKAQLSVGDKDAKDRIDAAKQAVP